MNFTFGIVTDWENPNRIYHIVDSIEREMRPYSYTYDIIVCGPRPDSAFVTSYFHFIPHFRFIRHDGWITQKKNVIAQSSNHDFLILMHDYFVIQPHWMWGYKNFGFDWDICSNPQLLMTGKRHFTDWVNWDHPDYPRYHSFEYTDESHTKHQYISGGYFLVRRNVLLDNPFNESMKQGEPEDVEWSLRVRDKYKIRCNPNSRVMHNKIHRDCKL